MSTPNVRTRRRKERKIWRTALLASLLLHLLVLLGGGRLAPPTPTVAAAGPEAGDARAASGGLQAMSITTPPPRPIVPPPLPIITDIEFDPVEFDSEPQFDLAAVLGERPGDAPPGLDGVGEGDAGDASEGVGGVIGARPRGLIPPPDHDDLKGVEVTIWVFVTEYGQVVADSTRLDPPTRNRNLNQQIIREAAEWLFYPATRRGEPISAWTSYTFSKRGTGRAQSPNR